MLFDAARGFGGSWLGGDGEKGRFGTWCCGNSAWQPCDFASIGGLRARHFTFFFFVWILDLLRLSVVFERLKCIVFFFVCFFARRESSNLLRVFVLCFVLRLIGGCCCCCLLAGYTLSRDCTEQKKGDFGDARRGGLGGGLMGLGRLLTGWGVFEKEMW